MPFLEVSYLRPANPARGTPEHTEHSVIFLVGAAAVAAADDSAAAALERARDAKGAEERAWGEVEGAEAAVKAAEKVWLAVRACWCGFFQTLNPIQKIYNY